MEIVSSFIVGGLVTILGLVGLLLAAGALDTEMSIFSWSLAVFALLFNLNLVKMHYDRADAKRAAAGGASHG